MIYEIQLDLFEKRREYLLTVKKKIEKRLRAAPEGTLRISTSTKTRTRTQFYQRKTDGAYKGEYKEIYLPKSKRKLVKRLAQKGYDQILLKTIDQEINAINRYLKSFPEQKPEEVYSVLSPSRKEIVMPEFETDEIFAERWNAVEYEGKWMDEDSSELYTDRGEQVRSKSEVIIANILSRNKIPYRYECPVILKGIGTVYPDFTILDIKARKEILWEHLGMMDDPEYAEKAVSKISYYIKNGYFPGDRLIVTMETRYHPLSVKEIEAVLDNQLQRKET